MTPRYQAALDEFLRESNRVIDNGCPHFAIIAAHELYRFLYPVEPHCGFRHTDPIPWIENHIEKLTDFLRASRDVFRGYKRSDDGEQYAVQSSRNRDDLTTATSDLYSDLWRGFSRESYVEEARALIARRMGDEFIAESIVGKRCLDIGCGSGRYSIALAMLGAKEVIAVDFQAKAFAEAAVLARQENLPIKFQECDVLALPFENSSFQTVFCNGVLHHTRDWRTGVAEYARVLAPGGGGFLYLYACGGVFWETRRALRGLFKAIPASLTKAVLQDIGMPGNRFVFMDTWYVPVEDHLKKLELEEALGRNGLVYEKAVSTNQFDLDTAAVKEMPGAEQMWGEGEHRYLIHRPLNCS